MDQKIYEFKPLFISKLNDILALTDIFLVVLALIAGFGIVFQNYPVFFIFPVLVAAIIVHIYKNKIKDLAIEGYKKIKIDEHHHYIFLDDLAIPFSDIACAEVFFENILYVLANYNLYGRRLRVWECINLVNATMILSLKNGTSITVPVQNESGLKKMIFILKKHIVVKCGENNGNDGMPFLILYAPIIIILFIILLHN